MAYINLKNVSVEYKTYNSSNRSIRSEVLRSVGGLMKTSNGGELIINALKSINLELKCGDRLALIGHNGAGKTTLLKLLSGIYEPTEGQAHIEGRVSNLFDITMGMDPELTGRGNIVTKAILLGETFVGAKRMIDDVIDFSELQEYIDLPMRVYSSGMILRLAFGIATAIKPQIILLDEIIGVGDERFAERAKLRMRKMISEASILVLASHSKELLYEYCNKGIIMKNGKIIKKDNIENIFENSIQ